MPDAMLAGLPRLVRAGDEIAWRGQAFLAMGVAVAVYWVASWLLDATTHPIETLVAVPIVAAPTLALAGLTSSRLVREGLAATRRPPRLAVYETRADARERHARFTLIVLLGAVLLLVFDRLTGGGVMSGLVAGAFCSLGVVDLREAGRWRAAERDRSARLYLLVRPNALVARWGRTEVYEVLGSDSDRKPRDPVGLELP